jgi:hypothetical protein
MLKLTKWISLAAFLLLLAACFMPWAFYADLGKSFTGFFSENNVYGRPAKLLLIFAGITTTCSFIQLLWLKRLALLVGGLNMAYAVKNLLLFGSCYRGYCPEKQPGLYLMFFAVLVLFVVAFFPEGKVRPTSR